MYETGNVSSQLLFSIFLRCWLFARKQYCCQRFAFVHFNDEAKVIPVQNVKKEKRMGVLKRWLEVVGKWLNGFAFGKPTVIIFYINIKTI